MNPAQRPRRPRAGCKMKGDGDPSGTPCRKALLPQEVPPAAGLGSLLRGVGPRVTAPWGRALDPPQSGDLCVLGAGAPVPTRQAEGALGSAHPQRDQGRRRERAPPLPAPVT